MPKIKLLILIVFLLGFLLTLISYLQINNISFEHKQNAYIAWNSGSNATLEKFYNTTKSTEFLNSINEESRVYKDNFEMFDFLRSKQNEFYDLDAVAKQRRDVKTPIDFQEEEGLDLNIPKGISYIVPGKLGYHVYTYDLLLFSPNKDTLESKYLNILYSKIDPISKKSLSGNKNLETSKNEINQEFDDLMVMLDNPAQIPWELKVSSENIEKLKNKEILENVSINEIKFIEKDFTEDDYGDGNLLIGEVNIHLENCFKDFSQEIIFSVKSGSFEIADINGFVKNLCRKQFIKVNGVLTGTCEDCTYYPADKTHALRSDYVPTVTGIGFAPGGQLISTKAYPDFLALYNSAKSDGAFINVTSGYRSYQTQFSTFESWVQTELAAGHSRAEAEILANNYSAKPGFSEHQLGTVVDLNGAGCGSFTDGGCSSNETVWNWLANNAYKFGFVQSYPEGKISETGYTTEPWHYRWIGKELALEYKNAGGGTTITLNKFLLENGDY